jgi:primosomal protein N' (replication factor Y)
MQHDLFLPDPEPTTLSGTYAEVVFDRPLDHPFTYAVSEELLPLVAVGKRLRVPFGRGDRTITGYCVGLTTEMPERKVKNVEAVLDEKALFTDSLLRLTRWMADYYLCSWGQVLNAVVPAGAKRGAGTAKKMFVEAVPESELTEVPGRLSRKQNAILDLVRQENKALETRVIQRTIGCSMAPIEALLVRGLLRQVIRRVERKTSTEDGTVPTPRSHPLNDEQLAVCAKIIPAARHGGFNTFLLYGVTGSGKTEVYLSAIEAVVAAGKSAIVLVPEISLTPQTVQRFAGRFGEIAVLHSHLGDAERAVHWRRVAEGKVKVVVGARSAIFAPAPNLGLIVIDEEHETSFKQDTTPRYHARDVAVMRARIEDIPIVLGSATPSLESWNNARRGQYTLLTMTNRVAERPLPPVQLVDLKHQPLRRGKPSTLSDPLIFAMQNALSHGGQVILFLNRRGYSPHVTCHGCGHVETCKFCDLSLTYHKERDLMLCHHCGYEQETQTQCPACGQGTLHFQGLGTEKLEIEIQSRFPDYVVRRMDSDTMRKPGSHAKTLDAFKRGEVHVLLGTQMIAKGLDFPNVTLVGVINADMALHVPDFRSAERTYQLLSQVAGRAGRGPRGGKVLVQTFTPEHPCITHAAQHDYNSFVKGELEHRQTHGYPPFQRLARLIIRSMAEETGREFADKVAEAFEKGVTQLEEGSPKIRLLGPAEAAVFRLKGMYRFHFQLQCASPGTLHKLLRAVMPTLNPPSEVEMTLDIDPFNMM